MTEQEPRTITRTDWLLIGLLLLLVLPLRLWLLHNTEVTARDSIGYIRYALEFERKPWADVLKDNHQHPGYPVLVWVASLPVRGFDGETTPENMELSAQLVSLLASLLLMLPMYLLGRQFFDRTVSFWGTLLYQYLPVSAQHLSDGISEPAYLVLLVTGLLQAVQAIRARSLGRCALCGLFAGLAYLFRPEGVLILPAFACVLIALQIRPDSRCSWGRFFLCGTTTMLAAVLVGSIYVAATGRITNKLSAIEILTNLSRVIAEMFFTHNTPIAGNGSLRLFAASFPVIENKGLRFLCSVWALISEITQGFHYIAGISAVLGFLGSFGWLRRDPSFWILAVYSLMHTCILVALGMSVSYVSDRHVMILVLGGCFFVIVGLRELPNRILGWLKIEQREAFTWHTSYRSASIWFAVLLCALLGICLPKATQRLHGNRTGNHEAGLWLSKHRQPGDMILDDHAWSVYFSGLLFEEGREQVLPREHRCTCYIVTTRSRDPEIDRQRQSRPLAPDATVVYVWPERCDVDTARIIVYAQPRVFEKNAWPTPRP